MRKWQRYDLFFCESHLKGQRGIKHFKSNPWTLKRSNKLTFDSHLNASTRFIEQQLSEHWVNGKNYENFYISGLTEWSKMTFFPFLNFRKGYKRHFLIKKLSLVRIDFQSIDFTLRIIKHTRNLWLVNFQILILLILAFPKFWSYGI